MLDVALFNTGLPPHSEFGGFQVTEDQLTRFGEGNAARGRRELLAMLDGFPDKAIHSGPTERPDCVRLAELADEGDLLELLKFDVADNAAHVAPPDDARILDHITAGTRGRGGVTAVIDGPEGRPVAVTILHPFQWWWSQRFHMMEIVNYVHPDHRRSRHIWNLLAFQRWCVDDLSRRNDYQVYLLNGVLGAWRVQSKIAMYRRTFAQAGAAFCYPSPFRESVA